MKLYEKQLLAIENKSSSQVRITRDAKIKRATGALATNVAKTNRDPIHNRMKFHMNMYKKYKSKLMNKYTSRVRGLARKDAESV